jgi:hypothetical protein
LFARATSFEKDFKRAAAEREEAMQLGKQDETRMKQEQTGAKRWSLKWGVKKKYGKRL